MDCNLMYKPQSTDQNNWLKDWEQRFSVKQLKINVMPADLPQKALEFLCNTKYSVPYMSAK